ncbi:hypothetical protein PsYK624_121650 [Phanerochaete sordida]|uniref:Uncharacterized protein n=1 Tax=Phanerochaete sordida TaxID=48140 RepID=A0A9P3GIX0_9APHY|nr:hypothetical protein PsYK624_121650 [Phanerochaete sordida]
MFIVSEAVVLGMMVFVAVRDYRFSKDSGLFRTVFRDGTIFYLYLFAFSAANVIVVLTTPAGLINLLSISERMVHSILTSRIILSLRALSGRRRFDWSTFEAGVRTAGVRDAQFAHTAASSDGGSDGSGVAGSVVGSGVDTTDRHEAPGAEKGVGEDVAVEVVEVDGESCLELDGVADVQVGSAV